MSDQSPFFALASRLRLVTRWNMKKCCEQENVAEHSFDVAMYAHALAVLRNEMFGGNVNAEKVAVAALMHDLSEAAIGVDTPTPVKNYSAATREAYKAMEADAEDKLLGTLPVPLRNYYRQYVLHSQVDSEIGQLVKAADVLSAYVKCLTEFEAGNREFATALKQVESRVKSIDMPEVDYFLAHFVESYQWTFDDLLSQDADMSLDGVLPTRKEKSE